MDKPKIEKLLTGIQMLDDDVLEGGIPQKHLVMITGTAGTMKSSFAFQMAYNNVLKGNKAIYVTLEQDATSIITQMQLMGFDLSKIIVKSNNPNVKSILPHSKDGAVLILLDIGYIRTQEPPSRAGSGLFSWFIHLQTELEKHIKPIPELVILDSLTALLHMATPSLEFIATRGKDLKKDPRFHLISIFDYLKTLKTTTIIINEMPAGILKHSQFGVESYLVDGVLLLAMEKRGMEVSRIMQVVKMRYVNHKTRAYVLKFDNRKATFILRESQFVKEK